MGGELGAKMGSEFRLSTCAQKRLLFPEGGRREEGELVEGRHIILEAVLQVFVFLFPPLVFPSLPQALYY